MTEPDKLIDRITAQVKAAFPNDRTKMRSLIHGSRTLSHLLVSLS